MGKHGRDAADRTPRLLAPGDTEVEVRRAGVRDLEVVHDEPGPVDEGREPDEPEDYGLRVTWQSEAVRIEAAEFLIATRIQQDARVRDAHELARLRARRRH